MNAISFTPRMKRDGDSTISLVLQKPNKIVLEFHFENHSKIIKKITLLPKYIHYQIPI